MEAVEVRDGRMGLRVRVQPKASSNAVRIDEGGRVCIRLTAPPIEGAANRALTAFVAKVLGLPNRAVTVIKGKRSREKVLGIEGIAAEEIGRRIRASAREA